MKYIQQVAFITLICLLHDADGSFIIRTLESRVHQADIIVVGQILKEETVPNELYDKLRKTGSGCEYEDREITIQVEQVLWPRDKTIDYNITLIRTALTNEPPMKKESSIYFIYDLPADIRAETEWVVKTNNTVVSVSPQIRTSVVSTQGLRYAWHLPLSELAAVRAVVNDKATAKAPNQTIEPTGDTRMGDMD